MPCFLFGDPKQLPPTVLTPVGKDNDGNFLNRFAKSGSLSALLFLQATGVPVYRLTTQLRMGNGLFDMVSGIIYKGVPHVYASSCDIANAAFDAGRALESYIQEKYPSVTACPGDKLRPVFIHTPGSRVFTDAATGSKKSADQVKVALDFLVGLLEAKPNINPSQITVIAPYAANIDLINYMLRKAAYKALKGMPKPSTVDSFQGQENDIVIVIMGTAHPKPGPGFTSQEQRLNVMLTRHRCGLVVVGDINVTGGLADDEGKGKGKGKGKGRGKGWGIASDKSFQVEGPNGETFFVTASALRQVHEGLHSAGRVITIPVTKKEKAAETAEVAEVVEVVEAGPAPAEYIILPSETDDLGN